MSKFFKSSVTLYLIFSCLPALANTVDFEVWKSALHYRITTQGRYDQLMELDYISRLSEQNPNAGYEELLRLGGRLTKGRLTERTTVFPTTSEDPVTNLGQEALEKSWSSAMKIATELPAQLGLTFRAIDFIKEWTEFQSNRYFEQFKPDNLDALIYGRERKTALENIYHSRDVIDAIGERIQKSPVLSLLIATETGISPTSTAQQIFQIFPDFAKARDVREIVQQMKDHKLDLGEIKVLLSREFEKINTTFGAINQNLREQQLSNGPAQATVTQKIKADRLKSYVQKTQLTQAANRTREEQQKEFARARQGIHLLATSLGWINQHELARTVMKSSNAFLSIVDSISEFQQNIALPSDGLQKAFSGILLTGNVLGAVQTLLGASNSPTFQDEVFNGLKNIRTQINESSRIISSQLSLLNDNLSLIYTDVTRQFDLINGHLENLRLNLLGVTETLQHLEGQLYNTEAYLTAQNSDLGLRPLRTSILHCLGVNSSSNRRSSLADTETCLQAFSSYALIHSSDQVATRPENQDYTPATVIKNFRKSPVDLERSFTYLAEVALHKFSIYELMPQTRKVNPYHWSMSSNALYQYTFQNPLTQNSLSLPVLTDLIAQGTHLELFIQRLAIGTIQRNLDGTPAAGPNESPFLFRLLNLYASALDDLKGTTRSVKEKIELEHYSSYDVDGAVPQQTASRILPAVLPRCTNFTVVNLEPQHITQANNINTTFAKPVQLESAIPASLWMAEKLGLGTVSACVASVGTTQLRHCRDADPNLYADRQCGKIEIVISIGIGETAPITWPLLSHEVEFWAQERRGAWSRQKTYPNVLAETLPAMHMHSTSNAVTHPEQLTIIEDAIRAKAHVAKTRVQQAISIGSGVSVTGVNYETSVQQARMVAALLRSALFLSVGQSAQNNDFIRTLLYSPTEKIGGADPTEIDHVPNERTGGLYLSFLNQWDDEYEKIEFLRNFLTSKKNAGLLPEAHPWVRPTLIRLKSLEQVLGQNVKPQFPTMIYEFWKQIQEFLAIH